MEEKCGTCCKDELTRVLKTPITTKLRSTSERIYCRSIFLFSELNEMET